MILVEASLGWEWRRISDLDNQASWLEIQSVGSDFCHLVLAAKANRSLVVTYLLAAWEMDDLLSLACFHFISTTLLSVPHSQYKPKTKLPTRFYLRVCERHTLKDESGNIIISISFKKS